MKLSIFKNLLLISMFMVIAVSCGKDKKSSGGSNYSYYNPYLGGQTGDSTTAKANLASYVNGTDAFINLWEIRVQRLRYSCKTKDFLGIDFLPTTSCSYKLLNVEKFYPTQGVRSTNNPLLATLLTPPAEYKLGNVIQYGNIINVDHVHSNNHDTIQYAIDISRDSRVNPIQVKDTLNMRIDSIYQSNI